MQNSGLEKKERTVGTRGLWWPKGRKQLPKGDEEALSGDLYLSEVRKQRSQGPGVQNAGQEKREDKGLRVLHGRQFSDAHCTWVHTQLTHDNVVITGLQEPAGYHIVLIISTQPRDILFFSISKLREL